MSKDTADHQISSRVARVETEVSSITNALGKMQLSIDSLSDKVIASSKTDWHTLGSWSAVIVLMISSIGYLSTKPLTDALIEVKQELRIQQNDDKQTIKLSATQAQQIKALERKVFGTK